MDYRLIADTLRNVEPQHGGGRNRRSPSNHDATASGGAPSPHREHPTGVGAHSRFADSYPGTRVSAALDALDETAELPSESGFARL